MTAPAPRCQPSTAELLAELRHHEAEYQELIHGPLCGHAADLIQELEGALREAHAEIVLAIAFVGRDKGTERLEGTLEHLLRRFVAVDTKARAALEPEKPL